MALAADAILLAHFLFVVFVVAGLPLVLVGAARNWSWVRNRAFRLGHFASIAFVAGEALIGMTCPLTRWEDILRGSDAQQSFVARWIARILYYDFPEWVFALAYCAFALLVAWAWRAVPPEPARPRTGA